MSLMSTAIPMLNRGATVTASNTTAATTLGITVGNSNYVAPPMSALYIMAVSIPTAGVTVSSISGGAVTKNWYQIGAATEPVSGVRCEMWGAVIQYGVATATATITFSGSTLASAAVTSYTEPYDYGSVPVVNWGSFTNQSGTTTGTHTEFFNYGFPVTAGNLIVVSIGQTGNFMTDVCTGVTDSLGTTYTRVNTAAAGNVNAYTFVYAGIAGASSSTLPGPLITVHWSGNSSVAHYYVSQYAGVSATVDVATTGGWGLGSFNQVQTVNLATTFANDMIHYTGCFFGGGVMNQQPGYFYSGQLEGALTTTSTGTYPSYTTLNNLSCIAMTAFKMSPTYTPTPAPTPNLVTSSSGVNTGFYAELDVTPQTGGSMVVTAYAVGTVSGDSFTGSIGGIRASVTPTVTSAASIIQEIGPQLMPTPIRSQLRMSAQRAWAAVSFELVAGNSTVTPDAQLQLNSSTTGISFTPKYQLQSTHGLEKYSVPPLTSSSGGASVTVVGQQLAGGIPTIAYSENVHAVGGFAPYVYSVLTGTLPPGLGLNTSTGAITGNPTTLGTYNFTIQATDSSSNTGSTAFQIIIASPGTGGNSVFLS